MSTRRFEIAIPRPWHEEERYQCGNKKRINMGSWIEGCERLEMPHDVFDHKQYPVCKCGRKFVPSRKETKKCWYCLYDRSYKR